MMNATQMCETMNRRKDYAIKYAKDKGWKILTLDRRNEIVNSIGYKVIPRQILDEGGY